MFLILSFPPSLTPSLLSPALLWFFPSCLPPSFWVHVVYLYPKIRNSRATFTRFDDFRVLYIWMKMLREIWIYTHIEVHKVFPNVRTEAMKKHVLFFRMVEILVEDDRHYWSPSITFVFELSILPSNVSKHEPKRCQNVFVKMPKVKNEWKMSKEQYFFLDSFRVHIRGRLGDLVDSRVVWACPRPAVSLVPDLDWLGWVLQSLSCKTWDCLTWFCWGGLNWASPMYLHPGSLSHMLEQGKTFRMPTSPNPISLCC